jgi:hypothetical protein
MSNTADRSGAAQADLTSLDGIVDALYASISGPPGPRDFAPLRALFRPGARLMAVVPDARGALSLRVHEVDEFIAKAGAHIQAHGFFEREIARRVDRFGAVTHVFSTYESRNREDEPPFARGINSIQLVELEGRFWVLTILWNEERPGLSIPEVYLPR